ncbi:MAG: DMT family transporter [Spirochaetales bacterium]
MKGSLALVACAFFWSTAGLFIKLLDWSPFWIAGLRSLIAGLFLLVVVRPWKIAWSPTLVLAAVANAVCMVLFVLANKMTTSANAILIQYWAPVPTALLAIWFLREKLHPEQIVALVATLAGLVLLFADKLGPGALWGNLAALASGLAFAFMIILTRRQKDGNPVHSMLLSQFLAAFGTLGIAAFQPLPVFTPLSIGLIVALGVVQMGLAALFFSYGIKRVSATTGSLLVVIEPLFNPVWVFLALGEAPSGWTLAGGALILLSVTAASVIGARRPAPTLLKAPVVV